MAHIFSQAIGGSAWMSLWYHFAIMFEALFILTTVDAGTRVGRFILQAFLGQFLPKLGNTRSYAANVLASVLLVSAWGYFLYQGVVDPQGGINSLWPLFGIANQLLALVALCLCTTVLIKMGRARALWVTLIPLGWLSAVTFTAGWQKILHASPKIGFLSAAGKFSQDLASGLIPAEKIAMVERTVFNLRLDAVVAAVFLVLVGAILMTSAFRWFGLLAGSMPLDLRESRPVWLTAEQLAEENPARGFLGKLGALFGLVLALLRQGGAPVPSQDAETGVPELSKAQAGAEWAKSEERRFQTPRCC
jgi:carbon starvation protein